MVSGAAGVVKPDPANSRRRRDRTGLAAADGLFTRDSARNVAGARAVGMPAHHVTDPATLAAARRARRLR